MAGRKLTDNNPNIADLSDTNRPTKLAEQYSQIYDNEWTEAFEYLDGLKDYKEDDKKAINVLFQTISVSTFKICVHVLYYQPLMLWLTG